MGDLSLPDFVFGSGGSGFVDEDEERRRREEAERERLLGEAIREIEGLRVPGAERALSPTPSPAAARTPPSPASSPVISPAAPPPPTAPARATGPSPARGYQEYEPGPMSDYQQQLRAFQARTDLPEGAEPFWTAAPSGEQTLTGYSTPGAGVTRFPPTSTPPAGAALRTGPVPGGSVDPADKARANQIGMPPELAMEHRAIVASREADNRSRLPAAIAALLGVPLGQVLAWRQERGERPMRDLAFQREQQAARDEQAAAAAERTRRAGLQDAAETRAQAAERRAAADQEFQRSDRERISANRDRERMETEEMGEPGSEQSYAAQQDLRLQYPAIPESIARRFSAFDLRDEATRRRIDELYSVPGNRREAQQQARARAEWEASLGGGGGGSAPVTPGAARRGGGGGAPTPAEPTEETQEGYEARVIAAAVESGVSEQAAREALAVMNNRRSTAEARRLAARTLGNVSSGEAGLAFRREQQERGQEILPGIRAEVEVTPGEVNATRNAVSAAVDGVRNLAAIEEIAEEYGGVEARIDRQSVVRLRAVRQPLMAMVANIRQTGVIQPGEVEVIENAIPNPQDFVGRSFGSFHASLREWRALLGRKVRTALEARGVSEEDAERAANDVMAGRMPRGRQRQQGGNRPRGEGAPEGSGEATQVLRINGRERPVPVSQIPAVTAAAARRGWDVEVVR